MFFTLDENRDRMALPSEVESDRNCFLKSSWAMGMHHRHAAANQPDHVPVLGRGASGNHTGLRSAASEVMIQGLTLSNSADKDTLFSLTEQNRITAHTSVSHLRKMKLH